MPTEPQSAKRGRGQRRVVPGDSRVDHEPAWLELRELFSVPLGTAAVVRECAGYLKALWPADVGALRLAVRSSGLMLPCGYGR
jgi:hypothetical protein